MGASQVGSLRFFVVTDYRTVSLLPQPRAAHTSRVPAGPLHRVEVQPRRAAVEERLADAQRVVDSDPAAELDVVAGRMKSIEQSDGDRGAGHGGHSLGLLDVADDAQFGHPRFCSPQFVNRVEDYLRFVDTMTSRDVTKPVLTQSRCLVPQIALGGRRCGVAFRVDSDPHGCHAVLAGQVNEFDRESQVALREFVSRREGWVAVQGKQILQTHRTIALGQDDELITPMGRARQVRQRKCVGVCELGDERFGATAIRAIRTIGDGDEGRSERTQIAYGGG